ncbi:MAG: NADH-quinone oxidoreductase subunit E, partial [Chthoniobacterales bacterium]
MDQLVPLAVALPLLIAALLVGMSKLLPRIALDLLAICTALGVTVANWLLLRAATANTLVYWFGGWKPRDGIAIGIAFTIDPISAGLAAFASLLVTASLVFAWRYFEAIG